jgi:glucose-1-phosphate cytidylyltransferase
MFLANYGDVLTNAPMNDLVDDFLQTDAVGSLLAVPPQDSFHVVGIDGDSRLTGIEAVADMDMRINGGYFILRKELFDYLQPGDDLVTDTFMRAARAGRFLSGSCRWCGRCRTADRSDPGTRGRENWHR